MCPEEHEGMGGSSVEANPQLFPSIPPMTCQGLCCDSGLFDESLYLVAWVLSGLDSCPLACCLVIVLEPPSGLSCDSALSIGSRVSSAPTSLQVQVTRLSVQEHW